MESLFPQILYLGPMFAPAVLRIALGVPYLASAYGHLVPRPGTTALPNAKLFGAAELVLGALLIVGLFVQAAALGVIAMTVMAHLRNPKSVPWQRITLSVGAAGALIILGAGAFAIDAPY